MMLEMGRMNLRDKLNSLIDRRGWKAADVARRLPHISRSKIYNWFNGDPVPDIFEAKALAELFGVSLVYLADDSLDEEPTPSISADETMMLRMIRGMGFSFEEVAKALADARAGAGPKAVHGFSRDLGSVDVTEAAYEARFGKPSAKKTSRPAKEADAKK